MTRSMDQLRAIIVVFLFLVFNVQLASTQKFNSTSNMQNHLIASIETSSNVMIKIGYIDQSPPPQVDQIGVMILLHGFPQTIHQFRYVIMPFTEAGYRVIVPEYRGIGRSSKPLTGFTKTLMADDVHALIQDHLNITEKVHVIGGDIGGTVAVAYALKYTTDVASLTWGETIIPGTPMFEAVTAEALAWHFVFQAVPDLPEALVTGRESLYLRFFFDREIYNASAISDDDVEVYATAYSQPGALRSTFGWYRAFDADAQEFSELFSRNGKLTIPTTVFLGAKSTLASRINSLASEVNDGADTLLIPDSNHYPAEENPQAFVEGVLDFVNRHR